ncbi:MAG TPA: FGGY family carbohydrate kinase, partial [Arenibacter sp.]|nr:FGGY family carbohydrate kinase [Arenibacter sp.]
MYYLGLDIGSSSIKVALVEVATGKSVGVVQQPETEMEMIALKNGWAEQDPKDWWRYVCAGIQKIKQQYNIDAEQIVGIGIAYQMHGLVLVDKSGEPVRNSIIWCDSRAVEIGRNAYNAIGEDRSKSHLLNSPANFTASKLKWVKENEPDIYRSAYKLMLPGDYIAYRFSHLMSTTISGLSEGILWDFKEDSVAHILMDHYGIPSSFIPDIVDTFGLQAKVDQQGAVESGLEPGTPIYYRAGDQPNNALALNVFKPGEVAATGGTSGVVYAITDNLSGKESTRVNNFAHVNYTKQAPSIGKLLNINGAGIQY